MQRLFRYDDWANREEVSRLRAMADAPARAVRVLAHIAATQFLWITRMLGRVRGATRWRADRHDRARRGRDAGATPAYTDFIHCTRAGLMDAGTG